MMPSGPSEDLRGPVAIRFQIFRSRFLTGARIKGMGTRIDKTPGDATDPIEQLRGGGRQALAALFEKYRDRLRRMVELRLDQRIRARLDASDVVQDAFLDVARDLDAYLADPKLPPLLWLRLHVGRRLTTLHRQHLGTRMRDAGQEISLYQGARPQASSAALAAMLLGRQTSPTQAAQRAERMLRVQEALHSLDPVDREVLALRHFEQLSRAEAAQVLGISQEAGAKRYFRALKRLKDILATMPGGWEGP
jgi:RNA polymerase sigma-70 factor, ECF subfamily